MRDECARAAAIIHNWTLRAATFSLSAHTCEPCPRKKKLQTERKIRSPAGAPRKRARTGPGENKIKRQPSNGENTQSLGAGEEPRMYPVRTGPMGGAKPLNRALSVVSQASCPSPPLVLANTRGWEGGRRPHKSRSHAPIPNSLALYRPWEALPRTAASCMQRVRTCTSSGAPLGSVRCRWRLW